jgi:hypothetical protein
MSAEADAIRWMVLRADDMALMAARLLKPWYKGPTKVHTTPMAGYGADKREQGCFEGHYHHFVDDRSVPGRKGRAQQRDAGSDEPA